MREQMKKLLFTAVAFANISMMAQSGTWTKDDRNSLYDNSLDYMTKYRGITSEQRESISLCYIDEITKKYSKAEFMAKIDVELKRIRDSQLSQCAKNIGVELGAASAPETKTVPENKKAIPNKKELVGKWKTDNNSIIEFKSNGTVVFKYLDRFLTSNSGYIVDNVKSGDWFLDEKGILTLKLNWSEDVGTLRTKIRAYTSNYKYSFSSFSSDYIKFENTEYVEVAIQANRME